NELGVVSRHERREVNGDRLVLGLAHPPNARRRTLTDVAEKARSTRLLRASICRVATAAHRERLEQGVYGVPNCPCTRVRAEVSRSRNLSIARHQHARHVVLEGDRG